MNTNNLVLNRLFTQNVFHELIRYNESSTYGTVVQRYATDIDGKSNGELISEIYSFLSKSYRNEYFYQNTLLNKLLLGKHSVNTTTALTQIPIGKSKADFILINGKAVVYEIKSELDSFERLDTQLKDYYKAFNHVCVVTSESYFEKISSILQGSSVGIYALTKKNTLSNLLRKEPTEDSSHLDHKTIFKMLHKREFENILERRFGKLPIASQVFYYDACLALFSEIPIIEAYRMVLVELKKRNRIVVGKFDDVPYELKSLVYFYNPAETEYDALSDFLDNRFRG